jgi:hypothetical protein
MSLQQISVDIKTLLTKMKFHQKCQRWDNIKAGEIREFRCEGVDWIHLSCEPRKEPLGSIKQRISLPTERL